MVKRLIIFLFPIYLFISLIFIINNHSLSMSQILNSFNNLEFIQLDLKSMNWNLFTGESTNLNADIEFIGHSAPGQGNWADETIEAIKEDNIKTGWNWLDNGLELISDSIGAIQELFTNLWYIVYNIGYLLYFIIGNITIIMSWFTQFVFLGIS